MGSCPLETSRERLDSGQGVNKIMASPFSRAGHGQITAFDIATGQIGGTHR